MHVQPNGTDRRIPRYETLLQERLWLGRAYADRLSHLQVAVPQAVLLFQRLLSYDAVLARFRRYDVDLHRYVLPAEDLRLHQPPEPPSDHHWSPCSLCLGSALQLDADMVLPVTTRRAAA